MRNKILSSMILIVLLLTGCGSSNKEASNEMSYDYGASTEGYEPGFSGSGELSSETKMEEMEKQDVALNNTITTGNERKIIDRADLSIETDAFDKSVEEVNGYISKFNGYIESSNITQDGVNSNNYKQNRYCEFIIRVPEENFENILNECGKIGVVTNKRIYGEDISSKYYDVETRVKVLKAQEERYLEILNKAQTVEEIIEIEKSLTDVRYEIESLTGYIKQMDNLVDYSTINLYIYEVSEASKIIDEPKTLGDKIINAFNNSIDTLKLFMTGALLLIVSMIPFALIALIISIIIVFIIKYVKKTKKIKGNKKE